MSCFFATSTNCFFKGTEGLCSFQAGTDCAFPEHCAFQEEHIEAITKRDKEVINAKHLS